MEKNEIQYTSSGNEALPDLSGKTIEWEQTYFAKHNKMYDGEDFAKIVVNLHLLKNSVRTEANGMLNIRWFTIRDKEGKLLKNGNITWTYSDVFRIPLSFFSTGKFKVSIRDLIDQAFKKRLELRNTMQHQLTETRLAGDN